MSTPDLTGFAEAQDRLRQQLGIDAVFLIPIAATYDPGVQLDPETGKPYDPTVVPTSGGGHGTMTKRCSVFQGIAANLHVRNATAERAAGVLRSENLMLGLADADFTDVDDAVGVIVGDEEYKITEFVKDPAFNLDNRYLVFGEAK